MYNYLTSMTVGEPSAPQGLAAITAGSMAVGAFGLATASVIGFGRGALFAPLPYIIASAAKGRDYKKYRFWLGVLSAIFQSAIIGLPGSLVGTFWMLGKLEKHLNWQEKK
jgi:hypothetical protein